MIRFNNTENILIQLDNDLTNEELKAKLESVFREYAIAVIEGREDDRKYPDAPGNLRFLNDLIFDLECVIDLKNKH